MPLIRWADDNLREGRNFVATSCFSDFDTAEAAYFRKKAAERSARKFYKNDGAPLVSLRLNQRGA